MALALILSKGAPKTLASSVVMGVFPVRATKTLAVARKQAESNFVCMCLRAQSMTELNQKLTKHSQKMLDMGHLHRGKILGGDHRRGGRAFAQRGHIFWKL